MKTIHIISLVALLVLIIVPFLIAKRQELTCFICGSNKTKKTGNKKDIERSRRGLIAAPVPDYDYEYECLDGGHRFWNTIEGI